MQPSLKNLLPFAVLIAIFLFTNYTSEDIQLTS